MTYNESESRVREILGLTSAVVSSCISESVKFLDNIFGVEAWDSTKSTVIGQEYIEAPAGTIDVQLLYVGDVEMKKLDDEDFIRVPAYKETGVERFYFVKSGVTPKIYFTVIPTAASTVKMLIKKEFTIPTTTNSFDCPRRLDELVVYGAVVRYYQTILSNVMVAREFYPDVKPSEIEQSLKNAQEYYNHLLSIVRQ